MTFNIGDYVCPSNSKIKPIYQGDSNEFNNEYVPKKYIGIVKGIRKRYINSQNEYNQYYVTFLNNDIKTDNCDNLYNEKDLIFLDRLTLIN